MEILKHTPVMIVLVVVLIARVLISVPNVKLDINLMLYLTRRSNVPNAVKLLIIV